MLQENIFTRPPNKETIKYSLSDRFFYTAEWINDTRSVALEISGPSEIGEWEMSFGLYYFEQRYNDWFSTDFFDAYDFECSTCIYFGASCRGI